MNAREYLESIMPSRETVARFLTKRGLDGLQPNRGWTFDPELGWVHADARHESDGVDGVDTFYHYENDGARRVIQHAGESTRIHTYGDSFTHCDQVNDGETWQEFLAAQLREPIQNYGVGGYSVYQAYRRMRKIESEGRHRAKFVILNIYDDDHFRNLDAWRRIRLGQHTSCGFTLPHLRINLEKGDCREIDNPLRTPESVFQLCDREWVTRVFADDPVLQLVLAMQSRKDHSIRPDEYEAVATSFGLPPHLSTGGGVGESLHSMHLRASLFATRCVLEMTERFIQDAGKKLMAILSFGTHNMAAALRGETRFDQELLDFLKTRNYPVIDMRDAFVADFENSKLDPEQYLKRYYNGHHSPAGNFFTAWTIRTRMMQWLCD